MAKKKRGRGRPPSPDKLGARINVRLKAAEKAAFEKAADRHGINISQWLRLAGWRVVEELNGDVELRRKSS